MPTKLTTEQIEKLLNSVPPGETVIAIAVPTRAFRIVMTSSDAKQFRLEQLSRQRGDKWMPISLHHEPFAWKAYDEALTALVNASRQFMDDIRRVKAEQRQLFRAQQAGALDVYTK